MRFTHFVIIIIFTVLVCAPLFSSGFYTSQDGPNHLIRSYYFSQSLFSGHWPGWVDELNNHQGYPIFYFSYPLPYLFITLWHALSFSLVDSLKITFFVATLVSGIFFYLWANKLINQTTSLFASLIYLFTPYRFLNLYVRAALGEIVFLSLVPVALYLLESKRNGWLALIISTMILSHLQLSVIFFPIFIGYAIIRRLHLPRIIFSLIFGIGLSSFFWLPALVLLPLTKFYAIHQSVSDHLVTLRQLFYSPWGFGFSVPGSADGMSFQLGIVNWVIIGISSFMLFKLVPIARYFVIICWLAILFMVASPSNIWSLPPPQSIQFPWRLLSITAILSPALILFLPKVNKTILILLLILALYTNRNHIRTNLPEYVNTPDTYFSQTGTATATPDEFMPITQDKYLFILHPIIKTSWLISAVALAFLLLTKPLQLARKK